MITPVSTTRPSDADLKHMLEFIFNKLGNEITLCLFDNVQRS